MLSRIACAVGLGPRVVHTVQTPDRRLFGLRSGDTTHVLCFREDRHARALAASLQRFYTLHGRLPACEGEDLWSLEDGDPDDLREVVVQATAVHVLMRRLRGTGLTASILSPTDAPSSAGQHLGWRDMRSDVSRPAREAFLAASLELDAPESLHPRPRWPPGTSAACMLLALAVAAQASFV